MNKIRKAAIVLLSLASLTACQFSSFVRTGASVEATKEAGSDNAASTDIAIIATATATETATALPSETPTSTPIPPIVFAVIGDYGSGDGFEQAVAQLVTSWNPDLIITTGDNNYPLGGSDTIDANIGQFYHDYIGNYQGEFGSGSPDVNRFFPSMGNHDWYSDNGNPYLDYFDLPGNERYYQFSWQDIDFFVLDSSWSEPDGFLSGSTQSTAAWQIVYFHHSPYTSGYHLSSTWMRWHFAEWGADMVLSGHSHVYERLNVSGIPYIVNGLGGGTIYDFIDILPESLVRYNQEYGALQVEVSPTHLTGIFMNISGEIIDEFTIDKSH